MTVDDRKKLSGFFNSLVEDLAKEDENFHYPYDECFYGACDQIAVGQTTARVLRCNWKRLVELTTEFFTDGPDMSSSWSWALWQCGFDHPEDLHDTMVGIFISGESREYTGDRGYYKNTCIEQLVPVTP